MQTNPFESPASATEPTKQGRYCLTKTLVFVNLAGLACLLFSSLLWVFIGWYSGVEFELVDSKALMWMDIVLWCIPSWEFACMWLVANAAI